MTVITHIGPRVWIGCLACYNAGRLVGKWCDGDTADDVTPEDIHGRSTAHEELWVMDHDGFIGALEGECSPCEAAEIARALSGLTGDESGAFGAWLKLYAQRDERAEWVEKFREDYRGFYDSEADFAREWFVETSPEEEVARLKRWPFYDIDWERASLELFTDGFHAEDVPGGIHVFWPN
ncbi:antirestriction protein ArdA [Streptomyces sp. NPDC094031]|uniref:antirestriction protein ArdA n=1 Tax=Streptomyces sp. NPDC094031 TaxID=3155307 RepID=UPI0033314FE7